MNVSYGFICTFRLIFRKNIFLLQLHGMNLGQLFRRKAFIRELPRTETSSKKAKNHSLIGNGAPDNDAILLHLFKTS